MRASLRCRLLWPERCAAVLGRIAERIDARTINPAFPPVFPRMVQFALWSFCAEARHDICNGRQIDDRQPCQRTDCPVGSRCSRIVLRRRLEVKQEIYRR